MKHPIVFALASLLGAASAHAQVYADIAAGISLNANCPALVDCNVSSTGLRITAGYPLNDWLSAEAGYVAYGSFRTMQGPATMTLKPRAVALGGALAIPFGSSQWGAKLRLGVAHVSPRLSSEAPGLGSARAENKLYVGLGVTYAVTPTVKLALSTEKTHGELSGAKAELSLIALGATITF